MAPEAAPAPTQAGSRGRDFQWVATRVADSWAWIRVDSVTRLLPFALVVGAVAGIWRPPWLGVGAGRLGAQLIFAAVMTPLMFMAAAAVQLLLSRRRGALRVPEGPRDLALESAFYLLNGPLEEAFFRGLLQGGIGALLGPAVGFAVATPAYVVYHRLGSWPWPDVAATALAGVPLALAFWLLPGPPSLLGVSIAHVGATCGFIGPGPFLLRRLKLL